MTKLFDFLNSINDNKKNLMEDGTNIELLEKIYVPFIINKSLSYFADTVGVANEMNMRHYLDNKYQYDFLRGIVRKRKRFAKWHKVEQDTDLEALMEYYHCSLTKAKQYIKVLTNDQLIIIKNKLKKGGRNDR